MEIVKKITFLALFAAVLLAGCQVAGLDNTDAVRVSTAKYALMQSSVIEGEINEDSGLAPKATIPTPSAPRDIPGNFSISNYPESGQTTSFAVTLSSGSVYQVVATTIYSSSSIRDSTVESYYIKDRTPGPVDTPNGTFDDTGTDFVCDASGTAAPNSRIGFSTTIWYGKRRGNAETKSTRYETIEATTASGLATGYAAFDIGGSLAYTDSPSITIGTATWSSKVTYTQSIPARQMGLDAVLGTPYATAYDLVGTRYYTETDNGSGGTTCSSLSFEKTSTPSGETVCESVVRTTYDIVGGVPGYKTVVSRSAIRAADSSTYTVDLDDGLYSSL